MSGVTKPATHLVAMPKAQTSEELLMRLQETIDPEPYNPVESRHLFGKVEKENGHYWHGSSARLTPNPSTSVGNIFQRFPSLGSFNRPAWLSGQPSPLSDLPTPKNMNPFQRLGLGQAQSDASSERSSSLRTPRNAHMVRNMSFIGRLDYEAAKN